MIGDVTGNAGRGARGPGLTWRSSSFLGSLTNEDRESLLRLGSARTYRAGSIVIHQGEQSQLVVVILQGIVKVRIVAATGKETLLGIQGAGDVFGEMGAMSSQARSATVVAATQLAGRVIMAAPFLSYLENHPRAAARLTEMIAQRLRAADQRRLEVTAYSAEGRITRVLLEVARDHGHRDSDGWRIGREITQADLASLSSASVSKVEKVLQEFERDGLVARRRRDLVVLDPPALAARAGTV
jgi:CRP/FNR family transcriptional regulator, cyclic AMP receptor protein